MELRGVLYRPFGTRVCVRMVYPGFTPWADMCRPFRAEHVCYTVTRGLHPGLTCEAVSQLFQR